MHKPFSHIFSRLLSDLRITWLIMGLAFTGRVIQLVYFFNIRFDGSYQYIAARNFLEGHGVSLSRVFASDLSNTVYEPLINWPPGYSLLLAPFLALFNYNYIAAGLTLDIIAAILLIIICRKILILFEIPLYLVNLFTLFTSFFIYYFYFIASSDAVTITLFLAAFYLCQLLIKTRKKVNQKTIAISLLLFACAALKYLFIPVAVIIPLYLMVKGIVAKDSVIRKAGIRSLLFVLLAIGSLLTWQKIISGSSTYISQPERGLFPENLLTGYAAIPASFLKPETVGLVLGQPSETGTTLYRIYQLVHFVLLLLLVLFTVKKLRKPGIEKDGADTDFYYPGITVLFIITGLLATLSLFVAKETIKPGTLWTYIEDPRYYGLVNVLLQLAAFIFYYKNRRRLSKIAVAVFIFVFLSLAAEMTRGMIFTARRIQSFQKERYSWQFDHELQLYADSILQKEISKQPADKIVVTGSSYYINNRVRLFNNIPILNENYLVNEPQALKAKSRVLLLVMIDVNDLPKFASFIKGRDKIGEFERYFFYTAYVNPR